LQVIQQVINANRSLAAAFALLVLLSSCHHSTAVPPNPASAPIAGHWVEMANRYQANMAWIGHVRNAAHEGPIMTFSLQQEWMSGRPILFLGVLVDAALKDPDHYVLQIQAPETYLGTEIWDQRLILQIECPAKDIAPLLASVAQLSNRYTISPTLGVIANVSGIQTRKFMVLEDKVESEDDVDEQGRSGARHIETQDDTLKDWKIGFGTCLHVESY
jgi:hypothetical protein